MKALISTGGRKHPVEFEKVIDLYVLIQRYVKCDWDLEYNDGDETARIVKPREPSAIVLGTVKLLAGRFRIRGYLEEAIERNDVT